MSRLTLHRRAFMGAAALLVAGSGAALAQATAPVAASAVRPFTQAAFDAARASGPVIVHVHADWCPTCRRQEPVIVFRANVDTETAFRAANRIAGQSTILVFKGGAEVGRSTGVTDPAQIRSLARRAL